jgi:hypothetical protein
MQLSGISGSFHISVSTQQNFVADVNKDLNNALHIGMNICVIFQTKSNHVQACALTNILSLVGVTIDGFCIA